MKNNPLLKKLNLRYLVSLLISIVLAFIIGAGILALSGFSPLKAYGAMLSGAFDSARHVGDFLEYAMVLCICGLACVLGARVGIFNVGGEGQLLLGAIFACQVGIWLDGFSPWLVIPAAALAAMIVGGFYAFIPGVLKVKVKVNEVITTIMMNSIAIYFCAYLSNGPLKTTERGIASGTAKIDTSFAFSRVINLSNLTTSIFLSVAIALMVWYLMKKSVTGYEMKLTGENERFAHYMGIPSDKLMLLGMVISGAICGLVGMFEVFGLHKRFIDSVSNEFYYDGMLVAMIMRYEPTGIILMSLFFGILKIGGTGMEKIGIPSETILIVQSIIIFFMAAERGISASVRERRVRRNARIKAGSAKGGSEHA